MARVKDQVRDTVEHQFDTLHRVADVVTFPFAPIDGAIHGIARGALNWLTDNHPEDKTKSNKTPSPHSNPYHAPNPYYSQPPPPPPPPHNGNYGYPPAPPPPPPYYGHPSQPGPGYPYTPYSYYNTGGHTNTGNHNDSSHQKNYGGYKFGNIGSS